MSAVLKSEEILFEALFLEQKLRQLQMFELFIVIKLCFYLSIIRSAFYKND